MRVLWLTLSLRLAQGAWASRNPAASAAPPRGAWRKGIAQDEVARLASQSRVVLADHGRPRHQDKLVLRTLYFGSLRQRASELLRRLHHQHRNVRDSLLSKRGR
jgi:hypothetical protein